MMMAVTGVLFALLVIVLAGWGITRVLGRREWVGYPVERLALAWIFGAGYISLAIFFFGLVVSGPALQAAVTLGAVILYFAGRRIGSAPEAASKRLSIVEWLVIGLLVCQAAVVVWSCANFLLGWDGLCTWETKARIAFAHDGVLPPEYFQDTTRDWSHARYPLGWAYLQTWLYLCLGQADQAWVRGLGGLYYLAAAALIAGSIHRLGGTRLFGLLAAAALFFVPMLTAMRFGHYSGYADFPLAAIFLAAATRLPGWHTEARPVDERIFAALGVLLVWTKSEGIVLFLALLTVAVAGCFYLRRWRRMLLLAAPGFAMALVFAAYLRWVDAAVDYNYVALTLENITARADRFGAVLGFMGQELIAWKSWSLIWPGTLAALVCLALNGRLIHSAIGASLLVLPWPAFLLAYALSAWPDYLRHVTTSLSRLFLEFVPLALLLIGLAASSVTARNESD